VTNHASAAQTGCDAKVESLTQNPFTDFTQTASKLQLVSAFVTAHKTAQQVMARHLAESHGCEQLAPAGVKHHHHNHQQQQQQQGGGSALSGPTAGVSSNGVSVLQQQQQQGGGRALMAPTGGGANGVSSQQNGRQAGAALESGVGVGDKRSEAAAQQVLRESREEADSALRYAHEVRLAQETGLSLLRPSLCLSGFTVWLICI
jgi:hypothetical protein